MHFAGVTISYKRHKVSRKYAYAIAATFRTILKEVVTDEARMDTVSAISKDDVQQMALWNPEDPFALMQDSCMHHLFEAKAREIPSAEAVCAWDGDLTYLDLDRLSSSVAQRLITLGVGRGVYVPIAYEKSLWTVVAMLGILKAGGAFVPLNPHDPEARLQEILTSTNAEIIITMEKFVSKFEPLVKRVVVVSRDTTSAGISQLNGTHNASAAVVKSSDPILVLFTSGSTGQPKGMIHDHRAICTHALTHGKTMAYHGARVLQFAAHTFDVAIMDIFTTLLFGGCVCIPSEEDRRCNIVGVINSMGVNHATLTPSFAELIEPSEVPSLKFLAVGGERLPQDVIQRWAKKVKLIQIYGPAEAGIVLTMPLQSDTQPECNGIPLQSCSCWLVNPDDAEFLVPIGAVGELVVAGPSLTRGYLNNEPKTRMSFLDNPPWEKSLALSVTRFYKTGDLLRLNTDSFDGSYDFVGRKDSQIKLRGQRIEPGEIEHHLVSIPDVATSVVTRPDEGPFAGKLVAVVQMRSASIVHSRPHKSSICIDSIQSVTTERIREHLLRALPTYMIPTVCVVVRNLPFVPSLKIDRKAVDAWLTTMESTRSSDQVIPTRGALKSNENTAHRLSRKVAELVAPNDMFTRANLEGYNFALRDIGIDSIQTISLLLFVRKHYSTSVPLDLLLSANTTIRELATLLEGRSQALIGPQQIVAFDFHHESRRLSEELLGSFAICPSNDGMRPHNPVQNLFLTGATGYLGSSILQQLMARPTVRVFALVRCPTESLGLERIMTTAIANGWWQNSYTSRIYVWRGDLKDDNLGLGDSELRILRGQTDPRDVCIHAIIHNGARVHYSSDYQTLKPTNVVSAVELLRITATSAHISAFLFVGGGEKPNANHSTLHPSSDSTQLRSAGGYTQTKVVAEHLVRECVTLSQFRSKRLHIVKPGYIIGSPTNGIANQSDFIWRLIAGCIEIGAYNVDEEAHWLFIADVDRVARAVVSWVSNGDDERPERSDRSIERVLDGLRFSDIWRTLSEDFGYHLKGVGHEEWMACLRDKILEAQERHLLFPLLHVLERDGANIGEKTGPFTEVRGPKLALRRNVKYLIDVGFFPKPAEKKDEGAPNGSFG
ncbi:putative NRPS-like protein biosynthetic cluster [Lepraria neglecta]|uniref:NRPS-like protein biosynthetic cluster n=1 Tax=Lepraria neglecta TaxID=209136 RepID=A0AAE0DML8_9LECA|nr:putative NRPS-like protein biosynthetic cluster [Lepraria neglecta]